MCIHGARTPLFGAEWIGFSFISLGVRCSDKFSANVALATVTDFRWCCCFQPLCSIVFVLNASFAPIVHRSQIASCLSLLLSPPKCSLFFKADELWIIEICVRSFLATAFMFMKPSFVAPHTLMKRFAVFPEQNRRHNFSAWLFIRVSAYTELRSGSMYLLSCSSIPISKRVFFLRWRRLQKICANKFPFSVSSMYSAKIQGLHKKAHLWWRKHWNIRVYIRSYILIHNMKTPCSHRTVCCYG